VLIILCVSLFTVQIHPKQQLSLNKVLSMMSIHNLALVWLLSPVALAACTTDSHNPEEIPPEISNSQSTSQIKSAKDLESYLQAVANSPFEQLSPAAKQRFISSLVFTKHGLASYEYSDLNTLSAADAGRILGLFEPASSTSTSPRARTSNDSSSALPRAVSPREALIDYVCKPSSGGCVALQNHACESTTCRQE
jgi:hypothetical protein